MSSTDTKDLIGYDVEIECPIDRKIEIKSWFSGLEILEHTSDEKDYDHLDENAVELEILNPVGKENLYIEISGEFTLFFADWHRHYPAYEWDYGKLREDALALIHGKYGAKSIWVDGRWMASSLQKEDLSQYADPRQMVESLQLSKEYMLKIQDKGATIYFEYWKPNDCREYELPSENAEPSEYSFPRRYGVRFAVKNGSIDTGSAARKEYDEETSLITYVYVEPSAEADWVRRKLVALLEADAVRAGSKTIFTNIDDDEYAFFAELGYEEIPLISNERIDALCGAQVICSKTMIKNLQ